ncbi:MAG: hypothetical protein ACTHOJ_07880 [Sphingomonas oligoaromativorans]
MDDLKLPNDTKLAGKLIEGHVQHEQSKIDRGSIGSFFGSKNSVPANVAAVISLIASLAFVAAVLWWSGSPDFTHKEGAAALSGIITLTIGFLFGRASKD